MFLQNYQLKSYKINLKKSFEDLEWLTGRWSRCSAACGQGEQVRRVECVLRDGAGVMMAVRDEKCRGHR